MDLFLVTILIVVIETALATYTAARAWHHRPARLFTLLLTILLCLNIAATARLLAEGPAAGRLAHIVSLTSQALFVPAMLALVSALFMPAWWEGSRPIRWILLPYLAIGALFLLDTLAGFGWFTSGTIVEDGAFRLGRVEPGGTIMMALLALGWLVPVVTLAVAFARNRATRLPIGILLAAILTSLTIGFALRGVVVALLAERGATQLNGAVQTLPLLAGLAYVVLRGKIVEPTKIALDLALQALHDGVAVISRDGEVIYANATAGGLGFAPGRSLGDALAAMGSAPDDIARLADYQAGAGADSLTVPMAVGTPSKLIEVTLSPVANRQGARIGALFLSRDTTELERRNALLDIERARLAETVGQLEQEQRERTELNQVVQALSLPVIPVLEGVLVLPLIGNFDGRRSAEFTAVLTRSIVARGGRQVLVDLTGVQLMDEGGVSGLLHGLRAAALLGARCTLVGIRPDIAQSLVDLEIDSDSIGTAATLQNGIAAVLNAN